MKNCSFPFFGDEPEIFIFHFGMPVVSAICESKRGLGRNKMESVVDKLEALVSMFFDRLSRYYFLFADIKHDF